MLGDRRAGVSPPSARFAPYGLFLLPDASGMLQPFMPLKVDDVAHDVPVFSSAGTEKLARRGGSAGGGPAARQVLHAKILRLEHLRDT